MKAKAAVFMGADQPFDVREFDKKISNITKNYPLFALYCLSTILL